MLHTLLRCVTSPTICPSKMHRSVSLPCICCFSALTDSCHGHQSVREHFVTSGRRPPARPALRPRRRVRPVEPHVVLRAGPRRRASCWRGGPRWDAGQHRPPRCGRTASPLRIDHILLMEQQPVPGPPLATVNSVATSTRVRACFPAVRRGAESLGARRPCVYASESRVAVPRTRLQPRCGCSLRRPQPPFWVQPSRGSHCL